MESQSSKSPSFSDPKTSPLDILTSLSSIFSLLLRSHPKYRPSSSQIPRIFLFPSANSSSFFSLQSSVLLFSFVLRFFASGGFSAASSALSPPSPSGPFCLPPSCPCWFPSLSSSPFCLLNNQHSPILPSADKQGQADDNKGTLGGHTRTIEERTEGGGNRRRGGIDMWGVERADRAERRGNK